MATAKHDVSGLTDEQRYEIVDAAAEWLNAGCCVHPSRIDRPDKLKQPVNVEGAGKDEGSWGWHKIAHELMPGFTLEGIREAILSGRHDGFGIITGKVSGGLEMLELEGRVIDRLEELVERAREMGTGDLLDRVTNRGFVERSPSGGQHILYRISGGTVPGNTALAHRPEPSAKSGKDVLAETRGTGGWFVAAPSGGRTHETGNPYEFYKGRPRDIPTITMEERDQLMDLFRTLDEMPPDLNVIKPFEATVKAAPRADGTMMPGEDYKARGSWDELLGGCGWKKLNTSGGNTYWCRPGKEGGGSASVNAELGLMYTFSTSTPLPAGKGLSLFRVYAFLKHGGDFAAAARDLGKLGYGAPPARPTPTGTVEPGSRHDVGGADAGGQNGQAAPTVSLDEAKAARASRPTITDPLDFSTWNDLGMARKLVADHGHHMRFLNDQGLWMTWAGTHWEADLHGNRVMALAKQTSVAMQRTFEGNEGTAGDKAAAAFAKGLLSRRRLADMVVLAQSEPTIGIGSGAFDADQHVVNLTNGTLDLRTLDLRPHDPADLITKLADVHYDWTASCPRFEGFLKEVTVGDDDLAAFMLRSLGLSLCGDVSHQAMFVHYGHGANGKSTLLDTVARMLGSYAGPVTVESLVTSARSVVRERALHMAELVGLRMAVGSEPDGGMQLSEGAVKQLTSTEPVAARRLHRDPFRVAIRAKMHLMTNSRPDVKGQDAGIWRRVHLVPWRAYFAPEERDLDLPAKLDDERPGILNKLLLGYTSVMANGLCPPAAVLAATQDYRDDSDESGQFLDECCVKEPAGVVSGADLYAAYRAWAIDNGLKPVTSKTLGATLTAKGFTRERPMAGELRKKWTWKGIRLTES